MTERSRSIPQAVQPRPLTALDAISSRRSVRTYAPDGRAIAPIVVGVPREPGNEVTRKEPQILDWQ
jgi:hypothetical protein